MTPDPRRWMILTVLASSLLLIAMDATLLNVALPTLAADLAPRSVELLWIVDAYGLVLAGLLVAMAGLGDRIGRRRLLSAGLVVFAGASLLAALAASPAQLIAARGLLGVGGAMIMPSTLSVLRSVFLDERERGVAIGVWTAVAAGGFALGPIAGGTLLEFADWPWLFAVQIPVVLVAFVAVRLLVPESRNPRPGPWDGPSVLLSVGGMLALVWGVKELGKDGLTAPAGFAAIAGGLLLLAVFVARQARSDTPLVDVRLFRHRRFATASAAVLFTFFALGALLLLLTQFLQLVQGHSPLEAGLRLLPLAVAAAVGAPLTDAIVRRAGMRVAVGGAFALVAGALGALSALEAGTSYALLGAAFVAIGLGAGVAATAGSAAIMDAAPPERAGGAAAVQETAFELGGALGVAVLGSIMAASYRGAIGVLPGLPAGAAEVARDGLTGAAEVADQLGEPGGRALMATANAAFVDGLGGTVLIGAAVMALVAVAALAAMPGRRPDGAAGTTPADRASAALDRSGS
jgi:DHA2 family multidrug resistance protein-like MFS transporter